RDGARRAVVGEAVDHRAAIADLAGRDADPTAVLGLHAHRVAVAGTERAAHVEVVAGGHQARRIVGVVVVALAARGRAAATLAGPAAVLAAEAVASTGHAVVAGTGKAAASLV